MKKNLQITALALCLGLGSAIAQRAYVKQNASQVPGSTFINRGVIPNRGCVTDVPSQQWEADFQKQVEAYIAANPLAKGQALVYNIPVIVHVIHGNQSIGTYPNISNAQVNSQITALNQDYAGTGLNSGNYPATAFTNYATAAGLPAANKDGSGRVKIANCDITFCMATKDTTGATLGTPGIDRVNYTTKGWADPASFTTPTNFKNYMDGTVKPGTVWNVSRYLNIWISDCNSSVGLLGYATFPVSSGLPNLSPPYGTNQTDGVWCWSAAFGSSSIAAGTYATGYDKGRTATHEIGHWLGLRHIGGDASSGCGIDGCNDTPKNKGGFSGGMFGQNYGAPSYPLNVNGCTGGVDANVNGDMFMNFMDYTDDAAMYMFTTDQRARIQTAMSGTCPYRNMLSASAATLCSAPASSAAIAAFSMTNSACSGVPVSVTNNSSGSPTPTFTWSSTGGGSFSPNANAIAPTISFPGAGNYTVTLSASNGTLSTTTKTINVTVCATPCNDTLSNFKNTDTLTIIRAGGSSSGYVSGNNSYGDVEKAEFYSSTGLVSNAKIIGGIALFYRHATANVGTKGTSNVVFKIYNGNNTTGPAGASVNNFTVALNNILASSTATNNVQYCGNPALGFSSNMIRPYSFNFTAPTNITGDFLFSLQLPTVTGDTAVLFMNSGLNGQTGSNAWEKFGGGGGWYPFSDGTNSWGIDGSVALLPKIACITDVINPNGISGNLAIFPNPSNGLFNFAVTMPKSSDLTFTVINSIGQVVYTKSEKGITNGVIGVDLSHLAKGVYSVNVMDSTGDKITRKIIIQ